MPDTAWLAIAVAALLVGIGAAAVRFALCARWSSRPTAAEATQQDTPAAAAAIPEHDQADDEIPLYKLYDPYDDTTLQTALPGR